MITKQDFDKQLKAASAANGFRLEGNYIVFDKNAKLSYQVLPKYTLGDLLTHNPVASYTKLNKDLLLRLNVVSSELKVKFKINSSYRSPEYNMTVPGSSPNSYHIKGDALDLGFSAPDVLAQFLRDFYPSGELGLYSWGCHIAICAGFTEWDKRSDASVIRKVKDVLTKDDTRNYAAYGILGLLAFLLFSRIF